MRGKMIETAGGRLIIVVGRQWWDITMYMDPCLPATPKTAEDEIRAAIVGDAENWVVPSGDDWDEDLEETIIMSVTDDDNVFICPDHCLGRSGQQKMGLPRLQMS